MIPDDFSAATGIVFLILAVVAGCILGFRFGIATVPVTCHFDGGGTSVAGSVTLTDTGRWYCNGDGQLTPWHGHIPDVRNKP